MLVSLGVGVGRGVLVSTGDAVAEGLGVDVGMGVLVGVGLVVLVGMGVDVLICVAVLTGVRLARGGFGPPDGFSLFSLGRRVAPVTGTNPATLVVVTVIIPVLVTAGVSVGKRVAEGNGVVVRGTTGEFVGVKNRKANASRVMARSIGVAVAVNLGVRTISGRVSSLSPDITNGI